MSPQRIIFFIPLLLSILLTPLAATSADLSEILKKGEVTIAVPEAFPPFGSVGKSGKHEGYDVDVAKLIAKDLLPKKISEDVVVVIDPMLATGNSAHKAIAMIKDAGAKNIIFACLLAAQEGVDLIHQNHPEVLIYTCCLDECLNELGYIIPGLGDAGDRLFGTV